MDKYEGLEYVKTDLVKSKGIIYVKFRLASSALKAKEDIENNNYVVRCASLSLLTLSSGVRALVSSSRLRPDQDRSYPPLSGATIPHADTQTRAVVWQACQSFRSRAEVI
jgi:hypothetical protein